MSSADIAQIGGMPYGAYPSYAQAYGSQFPYAYVRLICAAIELTSRQGYGQPAANPYASYGMPQQYYGQPQQQAAARGFGAPGAQLPAGQGQRGPLPGAAAYASYGQPQPQQQQQQGQQQPQQQGQHQGRSDQGDYKSAGQW